MNKLKWFEIWVCVFFCCEFIFVLNLICLKKMAKNADIWCEYNLRRMDKFLLYLYIISCEREHLNQYCAIRIEMSSSSSSFSFSCLYIKIHWLHRVDWMIYVFFFGGDLMRDSKIINSSSMVSTLGTRAYAILRGANVCRTTFSISLCIMCAHTNTHQYIWCCYFDARKNIWFTFSRLNIHVHTHTDKHIDGHILCRDTR